jgi:tetratricopeptide (TPR) repeat protein
MGSNRLFCSRFGVTFQRRIRIVRFCNPCRVVMKFASDQSVRQMVAVATFAGIGAGVYFYANRPIATRSAFSSVAPTTQPTTADGAIEIYSPPQQAFSAVQLDPMKQTDRAMAEADAKVRASPNRPDAYVELSSVYMQKARETADAGYLLRAEASCLKALELRPGFYDAMRLIAWVYTAQHRFDEAAAAARAAQAMVPGDAWNYGTLGDALVELGDYDGARRAYDQMDEYQPDSAALARVALLREIFGYPDGAISAMTDAVEASRSDHPEHLAWALMQRGNFYFNTGRIDSAQSDYMEALHAYSHYHLALAGLARVRMAQGKFDESEALYRQALDVAPYQETIIGLTDLLLHENRSADTAVLFALMDAIERIQRASHVRPGWLLVLFWSDHDLKLKEALKLARQEASDRKDIKTMDALAWALYKNQHYDEAAAASVQARRLGTHDALFYFHAGMIERERGHIPQAIAFLRRAIEINPHFDVRHGPEAAELLRELRP